jgi:hypothetical protein
MRIAPGAPPAATAPLLSRFPVGRRLLLTLAVASLCACGSPAPRETFQPVDSAVDPYAAVRAQSDEFYRQGLDLYQKGELRRALESFQRARLHDPSPRPEIDDMIRRTQEALASGRASPAPATGPTATPAPLAGRTFVSRAYNYAVSYPDGWRAEGASGRAGSTLLDVFADEGGSATGMIYGFPPPDGASQDALVRQSLALRQKMGTPYKRVDVRPVDDAQAIIVTFTEQRPDGVWLAVRQAVFQRGGTCWVVAVAAPTTDAARYGGVLDQLLDGFRVSGARA